MGGALVLLCAYLGYIHYTGNFNTIVRNEVYRSAQPTAAQITRYVADHGIKSVLNLRGASAGQDWYDAEMAASDALGLVHTDFRMSASIAITATEAKALVALMDRMPKPLLIHCRHGADRTGLAAALYLAQIAGAEEETAEAQLSIRYGHFSVPYLSDAYAMDESWERLEASMGFFDS
jgi:protein tyrosine/serine phosphatase